LKRCDIYTDGSCEVAKRIGGWAYYIYVFNKGRLGGLYAESGCKSNTTNNEMEVLAALMALKRLEELEKKGYAVVIYSDSKWFINCVTNIKWRCTKHKNMLDIVKKYRDMFNVEFRWVKSHSSDKKNAVVDSLAQAAMRRGVGRL